ncbi:MAG: DNA gyrase inhibitor YacG [Acidobacteria bacterium]|nr:DNA gyrase inhibitor YacG [Acidobacteriota bacterium]MBI3473473.1 DNA gyrase inhibitor YacG [Candidatus Solibacter usitatus]
MTCPICKKDVTPGGVDFPFCGERCRLIDLGKWASEEYRIPGPPAAPPEPASGNGK